MDLNEKRAYDARFKCFFRMLLAGPSGSGKTSWICNFIKHRVDLMDIQPAKILFFYHVWQPSYAELKEVATFKKGIPSIEDIENLEEYSEIGGSLVVIDDQALSINKEIATIFTVTARHTSVSLVLLAQNLFAKQSFFRDISLQSTYMVLFKNPRDKSAIKYLASQINPSNTAYVWEAYNFALDKPYSYILIDLHQQTDDRMRLKTNIFPREGPLTVFVPK